MHHAYQNHHIQPGIYMGVRTASDPIADGERAFMMASDIKAIEEADIPVKLKNLGERSEDDG